MKTFLCTALLLLCSLPLSAKDREWQTATYLGVKTADNGAFVMPLGGGFAGGRIVRRYYGFQCVDMTITATSKTLNGKAPDLIENRPAQIAIDGETLHVINDSGKEQKFHIVQKVGRASH